MNLEEIKRILEEKDSEALFDMIVGMDSFIVGALHLNRELHDKYMIASFTQLDVEIDFDELAEIIQKNIDLIEDFEKNCDYIEYCEEYCEDEEEFDEWIESGYVDYIREIESRNRAIYRDFCIEEADYNELTFEDLNY